MPPKRTIAIRSHRGDDVGGDPQPAEMAASLTRRRAMQLMAASLALGSGACTRSPRQRIYPYVDMPEAGMAGMPIYYASAFVRGGHAHGVLVGTREGRPIKAEGNPRHPSSLGATDIFAQASVLELWDPDRAQSVRQRLETATGSGAPPAAASTWSAFEAAWRERERELLRDGGARLRVLTSTCTSPSLHEQLDRLRQRFPGMRRHRHDPLEPRAEREGARLAFDLPMQTLWHLDRTRFVLALDADPFSHGPGSVRAARDWAGQRGAAGNAAAARSMAAETTPGLFGARADERLALPPAAIEAMLARIAAQLYGDLPSAAEKTAPSANIARFERLAVEQLKRTGENSLVMAGASLSPHSHALVHLLNQRLGAFGRTLDAIAPSDGESAGSLAELTEAIGAGAVDTLLVDRTATRPTTRPATSPFAAALARVPFSIHLSLHFNETSRRCRWQLPTTHDYEQWSDALGHDGSATLIQPAIAPLYDSRSAHEVLALLTADGERDGHALHEAPLAGERRCGEERLRSVLAREPERRRRARQRQRGIVAADRASPAARQQPQRRRASSSRPSLSPTFPRATAASPTTAGSRSCHVRSPS